MRYINGGEPKLGDAVRDPDGRVGTVAYIVRLENDREELVIDWDDDTVDIRFSNLANLILLHRCELALR